MPKLGDDMHMRVYVGVVPDGPRMESLGGGRDMARVASNEGRCFIFV